MSSGGQNGRDFSVVVECEMGSVGDCIDFFGDEGLGNKDCF